MTDRMKEISEAAQRLWANRPVEAIEVPPSLWDEIIAVVQPKDDKFDITPKQLAKAMYRWVKSGAAAKPYDGSWGK